MVHCSAPCGEITYDIKNNDSNLNDSTNYSICIVVVLEGLQGTWTEPLPKIS